MKSPRPPDGKKQRWNLFDDLALCAGGFGGAALGWLVGRQKVAQHLAVTGVRRLEDIHGPIVLFYTVAGLAIGILAGYVLGRVRRMRAAHLARDSRDGKPDPGAAG